LAIQTTPDFFIASRGKIGNINSIANGIIAVKEHELLKAQKA